MSEILPAVPPLCRGFASPMMQMGSKNSHDQILRESSFNLIPNMANIMTLKVVLLEQSLKGPTAVRFKGVNTREYLWSSRSKGFFIVESSVNLPGKNWSLFTG